MRIGLGNEIGSTGLTAYSGYVLEDFEKALQGQKGMQRYREMAHSHPIIAASVWAYRQMLVRPRIWIEPASESAADVEAAEFVEGCLDDMARPLSAFRNELASYLLYGFSWFECVYKHREGRQPETIVTTENGKVEVKPGKPSSKFDDGKIGWHKFSPRSQEAVDHWELYQGELLGMWHSPAPNYQTNFLPFAKCLHFVTNTMRENPEGISILRPAYRQYRLSMKVEDAEAIGVARNLHGLPVLTAPDGVDLFDASDSDMVELLDDAKKLVTSIKRDEQMGAVFPFGWTLELLSAGGNSGIDTNAIIDRYHTRIAMTMLTQFMLLGMERGGAFELAKQQQGLWLRAVSGFLAGDLDVLNRHAIPRLCDLNDFGSITGYPVAKAEDITEPELTEIAESVSKLGQSGFFTPSPDTEAHLRERAALPELEEDYMPLTPQEEAEQQAALAEATAEEAAAGAGGKGQSDEQFKKTRHYSINDVLAKADHDHVRGMIEDELDHGHPEDQ